MCEYSHWIDIKDGCKLPELDVIVSLKSSEGREYQGALLDEFYDDSKYFWAEWDGNGYEERVDNNQPVAWKPLSSKQIL